MIRAAAIVLALAAAPAGAQTWMLDFADLPGWAEDDHAEALRVFNTTCPDLAEARPEWQPVCALAGRNPPARTFFEAFFRPVLAGRAEGPVFTGYFEPEIAASPQRQGAYRHAVLRAPAGDGPWPTRAEIAAGALDGRGLEIAWLRDPLDLYYLQMQGSGRLRMPDGRVLRVGFAARNGHPLRPISAEVVRRGILEPHAASARAIRAWGARNPGLLADILATDPAYVFFRELDIPTESGPHGAMNRPLTGGRSLAVDPAHVPLGAPVWVEPDGAPELRRLMVAQDTGGIIRGPQRGDIFFGSGPAAEDAARTVRSGGRLVVLLPVAVALDRAGG